MGLKLKIVPSEDTSISYNVLDFDSSVYVDFSENKDVNSITFDKKITFNLYLDNSVYAAAPYEPRLIGMGSGSVSSDVLFIRIADGSLYVAGSNNNGTNSEVKVYKDFSQTYYGQILECEVNKREKDIVNFKVNGNTLDIDTSINFYTGWGEDWTIGPFYGWAGSIWNVKIYDTSSAGELIHQWNGTPSADQDSAWTDQIGSMDGSVKLRSGGGGDLTRDVYEPSAGSTVSSKLRILPDVETYTGVADFNNNSVTIVITGTGGSDDFRRGAIFKWKMWLDNDSGYANDLFNLDSSTGNPTGHLKAWMIDSSLYISVVGIAYNAYDITGFDNQILDCELNGGFGTYPQEFKINNEVQSGTNVIPSITTVGGVYIGNGTLLAYGQNLDNLDNGTLWDIQTETSLGVVTHAWAGYPNGNTLGAWEDTAATYHTLDAIQVDPITTRDIVGVNPGQGPVTGSVLLISPPSVQELLFSFITTDTSLSGLNVSGPAEGNEPIWNWGDGNTTEGTGYVNHEYSGGYVSPAEKTVTYSLFTPSVASGLVLSGTSGNKNVYKSLSLNDFTTLTSFFANHIVLNESPLDLSSFSNLSNLYLQDSSVYGNLDLTNNTSISQLNAQRSEISGVTFDTGTEYPNLSNFYLGDSSIASGDVSILFDYLYDNSTMFTSYSKIFDLRTTGDPLSRGATRRAFDLFTPDVGWTWDPTGAFGSLFTAADGMGTIETLTSFEADFTFGYSPIYQLTSGSKYVGDILSNSQVGVSGQVYMHWNISMDTSLADFQSSNSGWRLKIRYGVNTSANTTIDDTTYTFTSNTSGLEFQKDTSVDFTLAGGQYYNIAYEIYLIDNRADKTQTTGDAMSFQVDVSMYNIGDDDLIVNPLQNTRTIVINRDKWGA